MIAYKGFSKDLRSRLGDGKEETCQFAIGETKTVPESKTARNGFHCCENPFGCLAYYPMDGQSRFFKVEAGGDIDEDGSERIACTQITLLKELSPVELALAGMQYMISHPDRGNWERGYGSVKVHSDSAEAGNSGDIAIARGANPKVRGPKGSILGLIVEDGQGIQRAKLLVAPVQLAGRWLTLDEDREVVTVEEKDS